MARNYMCYKNGPAYDLFSWIIQIINPLNWRSVHFKWIIWSIKQNHFKKYKYPKQEFDFFMKKYGKAVNWFSEYGYVKKNK